MTIALALAAWLERQAGVRRVFYPGLPSHPQRAVAERQVGDGNAGGIDDFEQALAAARAAAAVPAGV